MSIGLNIKNKEVKINFISKILELVTLKITPTFKVDFLINFLKTNYLIYLNRIIGISSVLSF